MEKASNAVKSFLHNHGKEDTKVTENINPAVTHENVTPTRHENVTTAVDKEIHQDHYHTSVQPVQDKQVLPEQHKHNLAAVEHRTHDHTDDEHTRRHLAAEQAKHRDERTVSDTKHTHSINPAVGGEHRHHHLHETIQPVIERETVQPEVVHTTVPIHETHHEAAQHHSSSTLPAMTMNEFSKAGGHLHGRNDRTEMFEGAPHGAGGSLSSGGSGGTTLGTSGVAAGGLGNTSSSTSRSAANTSGLGSSTSTTGSHGLGSTSSGSGVTGTHGTSATSGSGLTGTSGSGLENTARTHNGTGYSSGNTSSATGAGVGGVGAGSTGAGLSSTSGSHGSDSTTKPSLAQKMKPKVDADGDGKAGFMS